MKRVVMKQTRGFLLITGVLLIASVALGSCVRHERAEEQDPPEETVLTGEGGCIRIVVEDPDTKAGGIVYERDEKPVKRWAFFLFEHASGNLAYRGIVAGNGVVTKRLRTGEYDMEVIANYPESGQEAVNVSSIYSRADFNDLKVSLGQNTLGAFVMAGTTEDAEGNRIPLKVVQTEEEDVLEVGIRLKRLVSKVMVTGITRRFTNAALGAKPMKLKGVYLTNVYTEARYASDYAAGELGTSRLLWYNALGWHKDGSAPATEGVDVLVGDRHLNRSLAQGETAELDLALYFYPNPMLPSTDVPSSEWASTARCTRLVVWVQVDGRDYYYPATLPKEDAYAPIARNSVFSAHCTLTGLGSSDEDDWIPSAMDISFEPVLKKDGEWDEVSQVTEVS